MHKLTTSKKLLLQKNTIAEIERMTKIVENVSVIAVLDAFKNKFNICETACKKLLKKYLQSKGDTVGSHLELRINQIKAALTATGYAVDEKIIQDIFGSSSPRGKPPRHYEMQQHMV